MLHPGGYQLAATAVPAWAREQLSGPHTGATPSLAAIEAGRSGDALWDDCQRCLVLGGETNPNPNPNLNPTPNLHQVLSGELHNNVRLTLTLIITDPQPSP